MPNTPKETAENMIENDKTHEKGMTQLRIDFVNATKTYREAMTAMNDNFKVRDDLASSKKERKDAEKRYDGLQIAVWKAEAKLEEAETKLKDAKKLQKKEHQAVLNALPREERAAVIKALKDSEGGNKIVRQVQSRTARFVSAVSEGINKIKEAMSPNPPSYRK